MIAEMRWRSISLSDWRSQAPRWTAASLAGLIAVETGAIALDLRAVGRLNVPSHAAATRPVPAPGGVDARRIAEAHLFGVETKVADETPANASETRLPLALSGVIATRDPNDGYAILGEKGSPTRLYRTGASLASAGGNLYQVFADRVVLRIDGRFEILRLPRETGAGFSPAFTAANGAEPTATQTDQPDIAHKHENPTVAESWFGNLNAEPEHAGGRLTGMLLHPAGRYQRKYGLRNGDVLTAVNGLELTDLDALTRLLKTSPNTMSLTFTRDGEQKTISMPVNE